VAEERTTVISLDMWPLAASNIRAESHAKFKSRFDLDVLSALSTQLYRYTDQFTIDILDIIIYVKA
jgi:hypothetical protein